MVRLCAFSDEAADSLRGQIDALTRNGITLTELRSVDRVNVSQLSLSQAKETARALRGEGIAVWAVGSPLGKTDISISESAWVTQVERICDVACALDCDKVRAFSFFGAYESAAQVFDRLNTAARIAEKYGVTLYHENEKEVFGDTAARVSQLMRALNGWKFIYDPANFLQVGEDAAETLALAPQCAYYHIKDVVAATGELVPAGEGDGRIAQLIDGIDDTVLTVEPHLAVFGAYAQIDNSEMKLRHTFESNAQAFDTAVNALKNILENNGWKQQNGGYVKNGSRT